MKKDSKIYVAGHTGLVGTAIVRSLRSQGYTNLIIRTSKDLDLRDQRAVHQFSWQVRPEYVFLAAARVGGIVANSTYPADFIYDNLQIQNNVIHSSYVNNVKKLLFLGSSCIYPKLCPQPMKEEYLLTGSLEPSNEWYAIAKIAGMKMCQAYRKQYGFDAISVMPTNLYGINDNFDLQTSHVLPAMIRKFHEAIIKDESEVVLWGNGSAKREFLHVNDLAEMCVFLMNTYSEDEFVNVGIGEDISICELAATICDIVGYKGNVKWDTTKPNGTPRKLLDVSKQKALGIEAKIKLQDGIKDTYKWYVKERKWE